MRGRAQKQEIPRKLNPGQNITYRLGMFRFLNTTQRPLYVQVIQDGSEIIVTIRESEIVDE